MDPADRHEVVSWIAHHAARTPERVAISHPDAGRHRTYGELAERVRALAHALAAHHGVGPGDRVAVLSRTDGRVFEVLHACALLGAIAVPLNWRLTPTELTAIVRDCLPSVLIAETWAAGTAGAIGSEVGTPVRHWASERGEPDDYETLAGAPVPAGWSPQPVHEDADWTIIYTSGTTGTPKGVRATHRGTLATMLGIGTALGVSSASRCLTVLPLFHVAGLQLFAEPVLFAGGTVVLTRSFDPARTLELLCAEDEPVTHLCGVPAHYQFVQQLPGFAGARLRPLTAAVGGSPVPRALVEAWAARGVALTTVFGITEAGACVTAVPPGRELERNGTIGLPMLYTACRVRGADGAAVAPGATGELQIAGPTVTPGYWGRPEATAAAMTEDGWLRTGDAARTDADGYLTVVDRWKDMYISGGENVYPAEVENALHEHPGVAQAAVVGVPHPRWGESGTAFVVPVRNGGLDEAALLEFCARRLARFKVPTRVVVVGELPRNATGKVLKAPLRERAARPARPAPAVDHHRGPPAPHDERTHMDKPSTAEVVALGARIGYTITDTDAGQYATVLGGLLDGYEAARGVGEAQLPSSRHRVVREAPRIADDPGNGWYAHTLITGADDGPLRGRTVAVKDSIMVAGVPMMNGASLLEGFVPSVDATVVTRVLDAGGTIVGKTACEYLCLSGGSHTNARGPVDHPRRPGHSAGGSSSGSAVVVARGEADLAFGADQAGSIRMPASYSGIVGMKPTYGLVPYTGIAPIDPFFDHVGPMTRTVEDNARLLQVISGPDGYDSRQAGVTVEDYLDRLGDGPGGLRVGVLAEGFAAPNADPAVNARVRAAAETLRALGCEVGDVSLPEHLLGPAVWTPIAIEGLTQLVLHGQGFGTGRDDWYPTDMMEHLFARRHRLDELPANAKAFTLLGEHVAEHHGHVHYGRAVNASRTLRARYDALLREVDVLLMPTTPIVSQPMPGPGADVLSVVAAATAMFANTCTFDITHHPAISLPVGEVDGLPVGMMLVGAHFDEATLYRLAHAYETRDAG